LNVVKGNEEASQKYLEAMIEGRIEEVRNDIEESKEILNLLGIPYIQLTRKIRC
jgi:hypothetical protein